MMLRGFIDSRRRNALARLYVRKLRDITTAGSTVISQDVSLMLCMQICRSYTI